MPADIALVLLFAACVAIAAVCFDRHFHRQREDR